MYPRALIKGDHISTTSTWILRINFPLYPHLQLSLRIFCSQGNKGKGAAPISALRSLSWPPREIAPPYHLQKGKIYLAACHSASPCTAGGSLCRPYQTAPIAAPKIITEGGIQIPFVPPPPHIPTLSPPTSSSFRYSIRSWFASASIKTASVTTPPLSGPPHPVRSGYIIR